MASTTDALLTEHLTYRPVALVDDIINSINTLSFRATAAVEKGLLSAPPSSLGIRTSSSTQNPPSDEPQQLPENMKHEIENGVHQLETLLESKIDKNFDRLEIFVMRNILTVPADVREWVRLGHYSGLDFSSTSTSEGKVEGGQGKASAESVKEQRLRLREMMKLRSLLLEEKRKNEGTIESILSLLGKPSRIQMDTKIEPGTEDDAANSTFGFLQNKGNLKGDVSHPVSTSTSFAISQLPALKSILENLKPRLDALEDTGKAEEREGMVGGEEKGFRRERGEFVETQTRRHLEGVRGLELGEMGEVRDGEWQGGGRVGKGEVEGLERIVSGLGGGEAMDES